MSSSSIARQNRRMRLKQLYLEQSVKNPKPQILCPSELNNTLNSDTSSIPEARNGQDKATIDSENCNKTSLSTTSNNQTQSFLPATGCSFINCDVSSRPLGKVFIEEERGFKAIDISENFQPSDIKCSPSSSKTDLAIDLAFKINSHFHSISNFCHGVLAGMSLLHVMFLFHLIAQPFDEEVTTHFRFLSQPVHNIFNFFCIICCISSFDRYDIGNPKHLLQALQKCDVKIIILFIYPICLLLSLSTANVDEKLCLHQRNSTWDFLHFKDSDELFYWKTLSISKCFGAVLGWIIISLNPNYNIFFNHLKDIIQKNKISS